MFECNDCDEIFEDPEFYDLGLIEWKGCPNCKSEDYSVIHSNPSDRCPHDYPDQRDE